MATKELLLTAHQLDAAVCSQTLVQEIAFSKAVSRKIPSFNNSEDVFDLTISNFIISLCHYPLESAHICWAILPYYIAPISSCGSSTLS